jgi:WD40 repeat protein
MEVKNPYVGPRTFTRREKDLFFGREGEARDLRSLVIAERLVLFYAQSGAGKSSLINARLEPQLIDEGFIVLPIGRVGGELPDGISHVDNVFIFNLLLKLDQSAGDPRRFTRMKLADFLTNLVTKDGKHYCYDPLSIGHGQNEGYTEPPHVLIIDQFEEIFTDHPHRWQDREPFFRQLDQAMVADPLLWVVLTLREDYVAALEPYAPLLSSRMRTRFYMQRMDYTAALEAVKNPAELAKRPFAKDVAETLINNLCQVRVPGQSETQAGQYVAPVQLQVVCYQLWEKMKGQPGDEIALQDLEHSGNVDNALADFYELAVANVLNATGVSEVSLRNWFERILITDTRTRGTVYQGANDTGGLPEQVVKALQRQFLLRTEIRAGGTWYELVHDRFIEPILQSNQAWWQAHPLMRDARAWQDARRDESLLYRGRQFLEAEASAKSGQRDPVVEEFLEAARKQARTRERELKADLFETGWGAIFAQDADPALQAALTELLTWRNGQAKQRFRIFAGSNGYKAGENAAAFLERQEKSASATSAETMPYYLTIVGPPSTIPFEFQYYIGLNHAVGRIAFDTLPEYANYARSVVTAESGQVVLPRRAVLFTTRNPDDMPTNYVYERLITPLLQELRGSDLGWDIELLSEERARKQDLRRLLEDEPAWSFLFVAAHALMFRMGDLRQRNENGALLCYDWPGPLQWKGKTIPPEFYFAASDADSLSHPQILGSIAFLFGECTAGTPRLDNFASRKSSLYGVSQETEQIAPESFIARLPQCLMSRPGGGALAVVGHVDVNWTTSFVERTGRGDSKIGAYLFLLKRLMAGYPVGAAMEELRNRFVRELTRWVEIQMQRNMGKFQDQTDAIEHATRETAMVDLRNYIILGDPAVRLTTTEPAAPATAPRPVLDPATGLPELKLHLASVQSLAWRPDGTQLLTVCADGAACIWPMGAGQPYVFPSGPDEAVQAAAWRDDGRQVATLSRKGNLVVWEVDALMGGDATTHTHLTDQADLMLWQPGGTMLAVTSGVELRVYDCAGTPVMRAVFRHERPIRACTWSPDGHRLASTGRDATFRVWDLVTATELPRGEGADNQENLGLIRWSPDGRFLAYTAELRMLDSAQQTTSSMIRILDATSIAPVCELAGHASSVRVLDWHPAGGLLVSVSSDQAVVWSVVDRQRRITMEQSRLSITEVAFSPDGSMLASAGEDRVIHLWNAQRGVEVRRSEGHGGRVTGLAWHPDSTLIAVARSDGVALLIRAKE